MNRKYSSYEIKSRNANNNFNFPTIIHQITLNKLNSETVQKLKDIWSKNYPKFTYMLWDSEKLSKLISNHFPELKIIPSEKNIDLLKFLILNIFGGIYVDLNLIPNETEEKIDKLLNVKNNLLLLQKKSDEIFHNLSLIVSQPNNLISLDILNKLKNKISNININEIIDKSNEIIGIIPSQIKTKLFKLNNLISNVKTKFDLLFFLYKNWRIILFVLIIIFFILIFIIVGLSIRIRKIKMNC